MASGGQYLHYLFFTRLINYQLSYILPRSQPAFRCLPVLRSSTLTLLDPFLYFNFFLALFLLFSICDEKRCENAAKINLTNKAPFCWSKYTTHCIGLDNWNKSKTLELYLSQYVLVQFLEGKLIQFLAWPGEQITFAYVKEKSRS